MLLGLLREDKALTIRLLRSPSTVESIRRQIESHTVIRERLSTSVDLPLSDDCTRLLAYAAEEANQVGHKHIGTEHLLLGLLRDANLLAGQLLRERGIDLESARAELAKLSPGEMRSRSAGPPPMREGKAKIPLGLVTDLTQKARDGELSPVVARDLELNCVAEMLCRKEHRNPMLVGQRGAGKSAIVHALAQRIADGQVPAPLASTKIILPAPAREAFECRRLACGVRGAKAAAREVS